MSIDIDHPNEDISTSSGVAPTIGGGAVSRKVMSTATATATQYARLATFTFPATSSVAANLTVVLTPKSASGSYSPVIVSATVLQETSGLSASSLVEVLSSEETAIKRDDVFLVTSAATNGTDIELHMQSVISAAYDVVVLSESFDTGVSVAWNDGATWSATDPTVAAATFVTSTWEGAQPWTPVVDGGTTPGTATYTIQVGSTQKIGSMRVATGRVQWSGHTGTGAMRIIGLPSSSISGTHASAQFMYGGIAGTGDMAGFISPGTTVIQLYQVSLGSAFSPIPVDAAGEIIFQIIYEGE